MVSAVVVTWRIIVGVVAKLCRPNVYCVALALPAIPIGPCGPAGPAGPAGPSGPVSPFLQDMMAANKMIATVAVKRESFMVEGFESGKKYTTSDEKGHYRAIPL